MYFCLIIKNYFIKIPIVMCFKIIKFYLEMTNCCLPAGVGSAATNPKRAKHKTAAVVALIFASGEKHNLLAKCTRADLDHNWGSQEELGVLSLCARLCISRLRILRRPWSYSSLSMICNGFWASLFSSRECVKTNALSRSFPRGSNFVWPRVGSQLRRRQTQHKIDKTGAHTSS